MCIDEQAFGYGAGYADATKKAQTRITALTEALHKIAEPKGEYHDDNDALYVLRNIARAALKTTEKRT